MLSENPMTEGVDKLTDQKKREKGPPDRRGRSKEKNLQGVELMNERERKAKKKFEWGKTDKGRQPLRGKRSCLC